jgi:uracil-DNA glycosylase family 4
MRQTYVHSSGSMEAKIAIVGEQPGYQEVRARPPKPFVGPAGQGLDECLAMTKIQRRELYITKI